MSTKETFAFISRHCPTIEQGELAAQQNIGLVWVGDMDAFEVTPTDLNDMGCGFDGVVVVHPAAALRLCRSYKVGVFKNATRTEEGKAPTFEACNFFVYDRTSA